MSVTIKVLLLSQKLLIKFALKILDILSNWIFIPEKPIVITSQCYKCCRHIPTSHAVSLWNRVKAQLSFHSKQSDRLVSLSEKHKARAMGGAVRGGQCRLRWDHSFSHI